MHIRASEYFRKDNLIFLTLIIHSPTVQFMGLNAVRALSLVSLILVFSSTIYVIVTNVKAVNAFNANLANSTMVDCDYVE